MKLPLLTLLLVGAASPCLAQSSPPAPPPAASAPAAPIDPERLALAEEVVALAFPVEKRTAMMMQVAGSIEAQMRGAVLASLQGKMDSGLQAILERHLQRAHAQSERLIPEASPPLFVAIARAYARTFTRDELVRIRAFVATPAGAKYVSRSAEVLADPHVAQANTAYLERTLKAMQPLQAEMAREIAAYVEKHPGARAR